MYTIRTSWTGDFLRGITRERGSFATIGEAKTAGRALVLADMLASPTMQQVRREIPTHLPPGEFAEAAADLYWDREQIDRNAAPYLSTFEIDHRPDDSEPTLADQVWFASPEDLTEALLRDQQQATT